MGRCLITVAAALLLCTLTLAAQQRAPEMLVEMDGGREGIRIAAVDVDVVIHGDLALVTQRLTFQNPYAQPVRGDLRFPLPDGATVSGYALDIFSRMVDGVAVEKERARQVFEEIVSQAQDPGLVEWDGGNMFTTRVYPIPASGRRTVAISYVMPLSAASDGAELRLPFWYKDTLDDFRLEVQALEAEKEPRITATGLKPPPFERMGESWRAVIHFTDSGAEGIVAVTLREALPPVTLERAADGEVYFHVRDPDPTGRGEKRERWATPQRLCVYWDVSGSVATRPRRREVAWLSSFIRELRQKQVTVEVVAFHQQAEEARSVTVTGGETRELERLLLGLESDGATNLGAVRSAAAKPDLYLVVTDGRHSLGAAPDWSALDAPVYAITSGGNVEMLNTLTRPTGGDVVDLAALQDAAASARILEPRTRVVAISSPGGGVTDLQVHEGPQVAGRATVSGRLLAEEAAVELVFGARRTVLDRRQVVLRRSAAVRADLIRRHWATRALHALLADETANRRAITELGTRHSLVTPYTSLMVLERLDQYVRYQITPPPTLPQVRADYYRLTATRRQVERRESRQFVNDLEAYGQALHLLLGGSLDPDAGMENLGHLMRSEFYSVPAGVFFGGETREEINGGIFSDDDDDNADPPAAPTSTDSESAAADTGPGRAPAAVISGMWDPDTPYLTRLRAAPNLQSAYAIYLFERLQHWREADFYLDCAAYFSDLGAADTALRILGNLAELASGDREQRLILARALRRAGDLQTPRTLLSQLADAWPDDPIVIREYAAVLHARGEYQAAANLILRAMHPPTDPATATRWERITPGQQVLYADLQHIRQTADHAGKPVQGIPDRLRTPFAPGLRVVLTCPTPTVDVDLWVTTPSGATVYALVRSARDGGYLISDGSAEQGLEEYLLPTVAKGDYTLRAYYAQIAPEALPRPVTVFVDVYSQVGTDAEAHRQFSLRLRDLEDFATILTLTY